MRLIDYNRGALYHNSQTFISSRFHGERSPCIESRSPTMPFPLHDQEIWESLVQYLACRRHAFLHHIQTNLMILAFDQRYVDLLLADIVSGTFPLDTCIDSQQRSLCLQRFRGSNCAPFLQRRSRSMCRSRTSSEGSMFIRLRPVTSGMR